MNRLLQSRHARSLQAGIQEGVGSGFPLKDCGNDEKTDRIHRFIGPTNRRRAGWVLGTNGFEEALQPFEPSNCPLLAVYRGCVSDIAVTLPPPTWAVDLCDGLRQLATDMVGHFDERQGAMSRQSYDEQYYEEQRLSGDRVALWWYARVVRRLYPHGGRLFDFGCGTGHLLRRLSAHFEAFGYDAAPFARTRARSTAPDAVVLEEWESQPPASFDIIVSLHTLEHLSRPLPTLQQLAAKLVSGGIFFFVVPNPGGWGRRLKGRQWFAYRDASHVSLLSRGEWVMLVRKAGLEVLSVRGDGMWDAPYVRIIPAALQRVLFAAPAALQVVWPGGRPFLPAALGECLIITTRKPA